MSYCIIGIDPGTKESGVVVMARQGMIILAEIVDNNDLLNHDYLIQSPLNDIMVVEKIVSMGMAVGQQVFDTVFFTGRIYERFVGRVNTFYSMPRREVKMHLCGNNRAKDSNIRQALIDKYPAIGGGKVPQIGTKKEPGPLFNIKSHCWSALALCITYKETYLAE